MDNFDQQLRDFWQEERPDFDAGFEDRLMARLSEQGRIIQGQFQQSLWRQFRIVGAAAAVVLFVLLGQVYSNADELSLDALLGVEQAEENQSLLFYDINT